MLILGLLYFTSYPERTLAVDVDLQNKRICPANFSQSAWPLRQRSPRHTLVPLSITKPTLRLEEEAGYYCIYYLHRRTYVFPVLGICGNPWPPG